MFGRAASVVYVPLFAVTFVPDREAERLQHSEMEALHATCLRATWHYRPSRSLSTCGIFLVDWDFHIVLFFFQSQFF